MRHVHAQVTDGNKKAPSEAHSAPTDGNEAQDSPVIGANAKSEPAPHSSRRSSWGSAVSRGSLPRGLSTALVVAARDGGADSEGGSGTVSIGHVGTFQGAGRGLAENLCWW